MRTAHGAGLMDGKTKFVFPAAGFPAHAAEEGVHAGRHDLRPQHAVLRSRQREPAAETFVKEYEDKYKDYPHWEADRAYFAMQVYKAGVEAALQGEERVARRKEDVINAMEGVKVESLGGPGHMRKDHIAEQTFYQGLTTHKNRYDFATLGRSIACIPTSCKSRPGTDFWKWIETAQIKL